jgi:hypothetical protein
MKYLNAQELKNYVTKIILDRENCGGEPSIDLYTILGHIVCLIEEEEPKCSNEINLVELLKGKPRETPLYSPMYGNLWLAEVDQENDIITCYIHPLENGATRAILEQEDTVSFFANGTTGDDNFNITKECQLFLKEEPSFGDNLEKAATEWNEKASFQPFYMKLDSNGNPNGVEQDITTHKESFKAGALWNERRILSQAMDERTLIDWYISSIDETVPPIWTEEHIAELCKDFYVIPKNN